MAVEQMDEAITTRMSVRAFTAQAVKADTLVDLLQAATAACWPARIPPCRVHILQGHSRDDLVAKVCAAHDAVRAEPALHARYREAYDYYPDKWVSPYLERRRENGWGLYGLLGIGRADKDKMHAQHQRNYRFFDAPVGLMFTLDRSVGGEALLVCGMFLQSIMLQARVRGLHTCPQAAWGGFASIVLPHIGAGPSDVLVCGMSLGYADPHAPVNGFHTPRLPVSEFSFWRDASPP